MAKSVTIGHLVCSSKEARDKVIQAFGKIAQYSKENEAGVSQYAITVPVEGDEKSIYMIEEYMDKAVADAHLACEAVQDLIKLFGAEPVLTDAPTVYQLEPIYSFTKNKATEAIDPYIVFANLIYKPGTMEQSLPYWKEVASSSEHDEAGTLSYALCKEEANANMLHTVEVYESKEYLWDAHAKSKAVTESVANTKHLREGLQQTFLKMIGGYLHK